MKALPLVVESLSWGHAARPPLAAGLSLTLDAGEALAVLGPNGAGKSTLLATMAGQLPARAGQVMLGGHDVRRLSTVARARRVALLAQDAPLDPDVTVEELVELGRTSHLGLWGSLEARDHEAVSRALRACDVAHLARRRLKHLSGGERQRAQLAMAVAQEAPLLLLDEPTAHLDVRRRFELFGLLDRLRQLAALAVVMVLQDPGEASRHAPRILVMTPAGFRLVHSDDPLLRDHLAHAFQVPAHRIVL